MKFTSMKEIRYKTLKALIFHLAKDNFKSLPNNSNLNFHTDVAYGNGIKSADECFKGIKNKY